MRDISQHPAGVAIDSSKDARRRPDNEQGPDAESTRETSGNGLSIVKFDDLKDKEPDSGPVKDSA